MGRWEGRRPLPSTVMMQGRPARCVSALSGGTVGRTVRSSALARVLAALAAQGRSNSGASDAAVLSRPAGLPGVSVLSVVAQWEGLSAAPVSRQGAGCRACHPSLFNCHGPCHWHLALARVLAALAAEGRSNSGASDAAVLSRPALRRRALFSPHVLRTKTTQLEASIKDQ